MTIVPVLRCSDLARSVAFYTGVLDFVWDAPGGDREAESANGVAFLSCGDASLMLSRHAGDGTFGAVVRCFVDDVDERYAAFRARGLDTTARPDSPIHTAPVTQTWGLREFAVSDPDGNALCFCTPVRPGR